MEKQTFLMEIADIISNKNKCYQNKDFSIHFIQNIMRNSARGGYNSIVIAKIANITDGNNPLLRFSFENAIEYFIEQGFTVEDTGAQYRISWVI